MAIRTLMVVGQDEDIRRLLAMLDVPHHARDTECIEVAFEDWLCSAAPGDISEVLYNKPEVLYNNEQDETAYKWLWTVLRVSLPTTFYGWVRSEYSRRNTLSVQQHRRRLRAFDVKQEEMF